MFGAAFEAPVRACHEVHVGETVVEVSTSLGKRIVARIKLVLGGLVLAGIFLAPSFVFPTMPVVLKVVFVVPSLLGLACVASGLFKPMPAFRVRLTPKALEVEEAPSVESGVYPTEQIQALVYAGKGAPVPDPAARAQAVGWTGIRVGVFVRDLGTVGLRLANGPGPAEEVGQAVERVLAAGGREVPTWGWPPATRDPRISVDAAGRPEGWPCHGPIQVEEAPDQVAIGLPSPKRARRAAAYALAAGPLALALAALAAAALLFPGGSWNPLTVLADPNALGLAILGGWIYAGMEPSRRLVGKVHARVSKGPYTVVVDEDEVTVLGTGHEVLGKVATGSVLGLDRTRWGLAIVHPGGRLRLPAYGLADRADRAWLRWALVHALDRWGGQQVPDLDTVRGQGALRDPVGLTVDG